jgi:hypothetical protein
MNKKIIFWWLWHWDFCGCFFFCFTFFLAGVSQSHTYTQLDRLRFWNYNKDTFGHSSMWLWVTKVLKTNNCAWMFKNLCSFLGFTAKMMFCSLLPNCKQTIRYRSFVALSVRERANKTFKVSIKVERSFLCVECDVCSLSELWKWVWNYQKTVEIQIETQ